MLSEGLASGRGSVKQRPNPPDLAAKTSVLGHTIVFLKDFDNYLLILY
jgi:hypothetical protein